MDKKAKEVLDQKYGVREDYENLLKEGDSKMLTKLERQQELEEGLGNALARVEDLEKIEEMHRKMNGELRQEVYDWKTKANQNTVLQNKIDVQKQIIEELSRDNQRLAKEVGDQVDKLRKSGVL